MKITIIQIIRIKKNKEKNINTETGTLSSITLIDDEQIKANLYIFLQEINMEN